jgi:hypothetical protein
MKNQSSIFIRPEYRPDLRAALGPITGTDPASAGSSCFASFPRSYLFSGCNEKSDKADKVKEIGKDDKANRNPVKDRAIRALEGSLTSDPLAENAYATIFA